MRTFRVKEVSPINITVESNRELEELYEIITKLEEDFIITDGQTSKVVIVRDLVSKVKGGIIELRKENLEANKQ